MPALGSKPENKPYKYVKEFVKNTEEYRKWMTECIIQENVKKPFNSMTNPNNIIDITGDVVTLEACLKFFRPKTVSKSPRRIKNIQSLYSKQFRVRVKMELLGV